MMVREKFIIIVFLEKKKFSFFTFYLVILIVILILIGVVHAFSEEEKQGIVDHVNLMMVNSFSNDFFKPCFFVSNNLLFLFWFFFAKRPTMILMFQLTLHQVFQIIFEKISFENHYFQTHSFFKKILFYLFSNFFFFLFHYWKFIFFLVTTWIEFILFVLIVDIFKRMMNGVLLCSLVNAAEPDTSEIVFYFWFFWFFQPNFSLLFSCSHHTVPPRKINRKKKLNRFEINGKIIFYLLEISFYSLKTIKSIFSKKKNLLNRKKIVYFISKSIKIDNIDAGLAGAKALKLQIVNMGPEDFISGTVWIWHYFFSLDFWYIF